MLADAAMDSKKTLAFSLSLNEISQTLMVIVDVEF